MRLMPLDIPPGFHRNGSQYENSNRWYDGNLVRFSEGRLRPIGGWTKLSETSFTDPVRKIHSFRTSAGVRFISVGTTKELKIWSAQLSELSDAPFFDITPSGSTFSATEDFGVAGLGYGIFSYGGQGYSYFTATTENDTLTFGEVHPDGGTNDFSSFETGMAVSFSTDTVGTLPGPLKINTLYYLFDISVSERSCKVAGNPTDADEGTPSISLMSEVQDFSV